MQRERFGILGGGNMGRALIGGLLRRGVHPAQIAVGESNANARGAVLRDFNIEATEDNAAAVANASFVVVAVKPQDAGKALPPVAHLLQRNRAVVLSFCAGIRAAALQQWCGAGVSVVRAMPNRPALVGAGATALFAEAAVTSAERDRALSVMEAVGDVVWVASEDAMDVVTALSGTGPAYFFFMAEMMMQAAAELGLEPQAARQLAISTLYGAGRLVRESDGDVVRLRAEVTSARGTTEAAMRVLEEAQVRTIMSRAIEAAARRSRELAEQFGQTVRDSA
jgi:pyrroline-5-carboxylate reductase